MDQWFVCLVYNERKIYLVLLLEQYVGHIGFGFIFSSVKLYKYTMQFILACAQNEHAVDYLYTTILV